MHAPRVIAVRKVDIPRAPALISCDAYPLHLSKVLSRELLAQHLRSFRVMRRKADQLLSDFFENRISEYELKKQYLRLAGEFDITVPLILASIDIGFIVEEMRSKINLIEKIILIICKSSQEQYTNFSKELIRIILKGNIYRLIKYRKTLRTIRAHIENAMKDTYYEIEAQKKLLARRSSQSASKRLAALASLYEEYRAALDEIDALQLTMCLGLSKAYSDLAYLLRRKSELDRVKSELEAGEISYAEYTRTVKELNSNIIYLSDNIKRTIDEFQLFKENFANNKEIFSKILNEKLVFALERLMALSSKNAKKIDHLLSTILAKA